MTESMLWQSASSMVLWCGEEGVGDGCGGTTAACDDGGAPAPGSPPACRLCCCRWARFSWCCCTMLCCTILCCTLMCWCTASWWMGCSGAGAGYGGESRCRFTCALCSASCNRLTGSGLWPRLSTAVAGGPAESETPASTDRGEGRGARGAAHSHTHTGVCGADAGGQSVQLLLRAARHIYFLIRIRGYSGYERHLRKRETSISQWTY